MLKLDNPCALEKDFCKNCNNHYAQLRPLLKGVLVSGRFERETRGESVMDDILGCDHINHNQLHKFEKHVDGNPIFRAKIDGIHIVYAIDKKRKMLLFLRAFDNFVTYKKFLEDDREIARAVSSLS